MAGRTKKLAIRFALLELLGLNAPLTATHRLTLIWLQANIAKTLTTQKNQRNNGIIRKALHSEG